MFVPFEPVASPCALYLKQGPGHGWLSESTKRNRALIFQESEPGGVRTLKTNKQQKLHPTPFWRNVKCKSGGWREPAYWGLGRLADLKFPSVSTKSLPADFWAGEWSGLIGNLEVSLWEKKYGTKVWNDQRLTLISSNDRRDGRNKQKHNRRWQLCVSWREGWDGA